MKPRYKVDLPRQLAVCEANYLRLVKLTPGLECSDQWVVALSVENHSKLLSINVKERAKYTTTVEVVEQDTQSSWTQAPRLMVCLYHDAQMAEVVAWEKHRRLKPRYDYPNRHMYHCDEKVQMNVFLGEWLSHCLEQGHVTEDVVVALGLTG
jgi:uncharacterized protein